MAMCIEHILSSASMKAMIAAAYAGDAIFLTIEGGERGFKGRSSYHTHMPVRLSVQ